MNFKQWQGFEIGDWTEHINVRDFINKNYTPYTGDADFLCSASERTNTLMERVRQLQKADYEKGGVL